MQTTTKAIVISSLKYGDTSLIVKCLTESDGIKSYLLKGVLQSKKGAVKPAYFQPLMQLEMVAHHKNKGTLERIREAKVAYAYNNLYTDIKKSTIALFLAEVLNNALKEEENNQALFSFLEASFQWLDTHTETSNFHIAFMIHLTRYLGFSPETSFKEAGYFDLLEGEFTQQTSRNPQIEGETLVAFKQFLGINFDAIHTIQLGKQLRQDLLHSLIVYFELHLHGFKKPKSLDVFNALFS